MKKYTKEDLKSLRHQPAEEFCRTMKDFLSDLPERQAQITVQNRSASTFAGQLNGSFVKKTFVAAAAVLLFVSGLLMMRHNGQFAEQFTSPELITQVSSSEAPENGFIPVADGGIEESAGLLDRIDIFVEPDLLWNNETGILAEGDRIVKVPGTSYANAVYRNAVYREMSELERSAEAEIEYHSSQSGGSFRQRIRMSLSGDYYSMDMPQKSLMIEAADGSFEYPLFDHRTATAYVSFLLSNGGTDNLFTRLADGVQSRLIDKYLDTNLLTLAWKPVSVYLNGDYWGIYNMLESPDAYTICRHEGIKQETAGDVTILRLNGSAIQGNGNPYKQILTAIRSGDPANNPDDLRLIEENIDIDSYLDWLAVKMYFGDSGAASNFICYQVPGGKWKCLAQDFNNALFQSGYDSVSGYLKEEGLGATNAENAVFRKILEVDAYRKRFLEKMGCLFRVMTTEVMQRELDECAAWIAPEMMKHLTRWEAENKVYKNENGPVDIESAYQYWEKRVERMNETMVKRPGYVYQYVQDFFGLSEKEMAVYFGR